MNSFGYLIVIVGAYSLYMLKKNKDEKVKFQNLNAYIGSVIIIILGVLVIASSLELEESAKNILMLILKGTLCVILMTYGIIVAAMPLFFKTKVDGVLLRFQSQIQKGCRGCFSFSIEGKCYQAESELIPKKMLKEQYKEGHTYPIWISGKFSGICRINRFYEMWTGVLYLVAGVIFAVSIVTGL